VISARNGVKHNGFRLALLACFLITLLSVSASLRYEVHNQAAGGRVVPDTRGGKLRYGITSENAWRVFNSRRDPTLRTNRPLTTSERSEFERDSARVASRNVAVYWYRTWFPLLALLTPAGAVCAGWIACRSQERRQKILAGFFAAACLLSWLELIFRLCDYNGR
jgi:hypothetical protein